MGCASSKNSHVEVYRPAPSSFAVFDITSIQEPWLNAAGDNESEPESESNVEPDYNKKHNSHVPAQLLEKLNAIEDADPRTWEEVSKELEQLKPNLNKLSTSAPKPAPKKVLNATPTQPAQQVIISKPRLKRKSFSFHTLSELEAKTSTGSKHAGLKRVESGKPELQRSQSGRGLGNEVVVPKSLKENIFILRDRKERREKE